MSISPNNPIRPLAFLVALGVLGTFLACAFFHLPLVMRTWGPPSPATDPASLLALVAVAGLYLISHGLILAGLLLLLHRAAPAPARPVLTWWLRVLGTVASMMLGLWPIAVLAPMARRMDGRRPALLAIVGGCAQLAALLLLRVREPAVLFWVWAGCILAGTLLLLEALRCLAGGGRAFKAFYIVLLAAAALSFATHPVRLAPRVGRQADALLAELLEQTGSAFRPDSPLPAALPPADPADDPIAALDADTLEADADSFNELWCRLQTQPPPRSRPITPAEADLLAGWFPGHPALTAAAEAFASPGYRSSRPAAPDDDWLEPYAFDAIAIYTPLLAWRAALAFSRADAPAALADLARIARCRDAIAAEPGLSGLAYAAAINELPFDTGAFPARLDLWPDAALEDAVRDADAFADRQETLWTDAWTVTLLRDARRLAAMESGTMPAVEPPGTERLPVPFAPLANYRREYGRLAAYRMLATALPTIRATLDLPPGPDRAAAHRALVAELTEAEAALPAATDDLEHNPAGAMLFILDHPRTQAAVVRTAVAVELHRRATGALPPDLSSLVPSRLPAIPIDAYTGAPLSYTPGDIGFILGYPDPADSSRPARPIRFPVP